MRNPQLTDLAEVIKWFKKYAVITVTSASQKRHKLAD